MYVSFRGTSQQNSRHEKRYRARQAVLQNRPPSQSCAECRDLETVRLRTRSTSHKTRALFILHETHGWLVTTPLSQGTCLCSVWTERAARTKCHRRTNLPLYPPKMTSCQLRSRSYPLVRTSSLQNVRRRNQAHRKPSGRSSMSSQQKQPPPKRPALPHLNLLTHPHTPLPHLYTVRRKRTGDSYRHEL